VTELTAIGGKNKVLQGNMEDGQDPLKRETAPYFRVDSRDKTQRKHSNPQILPENTSENLAIPGKRERWVL
tara:strand:+ start:328 stop:540 length:213 start_codon:yes stop_codon:yes gene_type:complete